MFEDSLLFFIKVAIVLLCFFIPVRYGLHAVAEGKFMDKISEGLSRSVSANISKSVPFLVRSMRKQVIPSTVTAINKEFEKRVETHIEKYRNMTPEEQEKLRKAVREYVQGIKPVIDEVLVLWEDNENGSGDSDE